VFNQGWREQPRVTAGPFRFEGINQTTKTITLVRNENWWGEPARLDRIVYRVLEATAQIDALANGEIDFFDIGPDANMYNRARGIAGVEIRSAGGPNFRHVTINGTSPNLRDVRVRQALAMGIDRTAIARALLGPLGVSPEPLNNHIFMANQAGYRDNSGEVGQFNPERAGQLLDEAGWVLEGAVRRKDDRPLEITMVIPSGVATSRQESEHAGPDWCETADQHGSEPGFLREIHHPGRVRLHRLFLDRHALSDQLDRVHLQAADHRRRR
jgi:peptide/nickel transport system substrate-binding protein